MQLQFQILGMDFNGSCTRNFSRLKAYRNFGKVKSKFDKNVMLFFVLEILQECVEFLILCVFFK